MTIEQWIETYKPKSHHDDLRSFIQGPGRNIYNIYIWSVVPDNGKYMLVPNKKLAYGQLFIICEIGWEDEDVQLEFTNDDLITLVKKIEKSKNKLIV